MPDPPSVEQWHVSVPSHAAIVHGKARLNQSNSAWWAIFLDSDTLQAWQSRVHRARREPAGCARLRPVGGQPERDQRSDGRGCLQPGGETAGTCLECGTGAMSRSWGGPTAVHLAALNDSLVHIALLVAWGTDLGRQIASACHPWRTWEELPSEQQTVDAGVVAIAELAQVVCPRHPVLVGCRQRVQGRRIEGRFERRGRRRCR